jgi:glucokinase
MEATVAIDLGGTIIKAGLLRNGELLAGMEMDSHNARSLGAILPHLANLVENLLNTAGLKASDVAGLGLAFAGLVDSEQQRIISTNKKYDDGPDIDLKAWAHENWSWPLAVENDTRMALLGEWQYGSGQDCRDLVMVTLGTGVGSAVLMDGKLLYGRHFKAGNLGGHFTVNYRGYPCTCGNVGCVEAEASTWRLPSLLKSHPGFEHSSLVPEHVLDFETLLRHSDAGDAVAEEILEHCIAVWSAGIITMIHAFDPEKVILGGGVMHAAGRILPALQEQVDRFAWTPWGKVALLQARNLRTAALHGADYLIRSTVHS